MLTRGIKRKLNLFSIYDHEVFGGTDMPSPLGIHFIHFLWRNYSKVVSFSHNFRNCHSWTDFQNTKIMWQLKFSQRWGHNSWFSGLLRRVVLKMDAAWTFWNVSILSQHYTVSQPRRPRLESSPPWKPQISHLRTKQHLTFVRQSQVQTQCI
jgi:hypothetical protein